jgi:ABC-type multidrug transport system fused ATPase/permease subunit
MFRLFCEILAPFRRAYRLYLAGVVLRQALVVAGGYSLVWALRLCLSHATLPEWLFVAGFILFDTGYQAFDLGLNYFFSARVSYPLFAKLRFDALEKVFGLPLEWHQRQSSGELVGKVNNGVGKVVQTSEDLSRELLPALQTGFSLVPLLIFTPATSPALLVALVIFLWLTIAEQRQRQPFARRRYRTYNRDFGVFAESVQAIQPVVQFGQIGRVLRKYRKVQQYIIKQGLTEARIGNRFGLHRSLAVSIAKRVCQGVWIWQYRHHALDAAMIMYLNMLTEQLLASFAGYASLLERIYDGLEPTRVLVKLLAEQRAIADNATATLATVPATIAVRMKDVRFSYSRRKQAVLRDFDLRIAPATVLGIVGRSGSGKTTLQNLLTRMFDIQHGSIEICGKDVRQWPLEQLRGIFSHVSQNGGVFFSGTSFGLPSRKPLYARSSR